MAAVVVTLKFPSIHSVMAEAETLTLAPTRARLSLPRLLKLCARSSALSPGQQLHALSWKLGLHPDLFLSTTLISFYSTCGHLHIALQVFDKMPHKNAVSWTSTINAFLCSGRPDSALSYFSQMLESGIAADSFSLVGALSACAHLSSLNLGRNVHSYITKTGIEVVDFAGTALVDMYCKCGSIDDASMVFSSIPIDAKTIQTWNAMIHGLAVHGLGLSALKVFDEMKSAGVKPNEVTFIALLFACAHSGLLAEGKSHFEEMTRAYGIEPQLKHYGCMVDMLGRAGRLQEAFDMIVNMRVSPNFIVWGSLLSACRLHGNLSMAERAMEAMRGEGRPAGDTSHYVILSNMYRGVGLMEKIADVRDMVGSKPVGLSWVEVDGEVHTFGVGRVNSSGEIWGDIKAKLDEVEERVRGKTTGEECLGEPHSEKMALAFGLIRVGASLPLRISKNLRICGDCHDFMKVVSEDCAREIVVRDCNRFHRFIGGQCSCRDYW
ncbi:putative pentatricopeptide repeat-containing protein [Platanthera zijinensis]|uniref:Pentatricopeptide repeat-containing protein n=1 Tax=Platanthera zijinensis TaxID=2320716 RepID=A0AAP0AUL6_9ASPA